MRKPSKQTTRDIKIISLCSLIFMFIGAIILIISQQTLIQTLTETNCCNDLDVIRKQYHQPSVIFEDGDCAVWRMEKNETTNNN